MPKKCKICKGKYDPKGINGELEQYCSPSCGAKLALQLLESKKAKEYKERKRKLREELTDWSKELQKVVNKIALTIDSGLPCLATKKDTGTLHGGHVFNKGFHRNMRYNLHNIHRQSGQSNHYQSNDIQMYEGVESEYGAEYLAFLKELRNTPYIKRSNAELMQCTKRAKKFLKTLNNSLKTKNERILLRNEANMAINIYDKKDCCFL